MKPMKRTSAAKNRENRRKAFEHLPNNPPGAFHRPGSNKK